MSLANELGWWDAIHGETHTMDGSPCKCAKGQPCSEHTAALTPSVLTWAIDLQRKFTGSKGYFSANVYFGLFQGRGGDSLP